MNGPYYSTNAIHKAYVAQDDTILSFFEQPLNPDWPALYRKVVGRFSNTALIGELIRQNAPAVNEVIKSHLDNLQSGNAALVITGQQLGLMVSPLYTVYKIITALKLARELNEYPAGMKVVPVFWLEGEDHDFDEINHTFLWKNDGTLQILSLQEVEAQRNHSVSRRVLTDEITGIISNLEEILSDTEFKPALIGLLRTIYQPGRSWLEAFREHILSLFSSHGLLCFNPADVGIKEQSRPFFENLLVNNQELRNAFLADSERLEKEGFFNQVKLLENRSYIFFNDRGKIRQPLFTGKNGFYIRNPERRFSTGELRQLLSEHPDWYSSSVLTRPLWQSWMLPVISYIAGPGEVAYWAQLRSAFSALDLPMPQIMPRSSMTLIEPRIHRLMIKYQITLMDLTGTKDEFIRSHIASALTGDIEKKYRVFLEQLHDFRKQLDISAAGIDETLSPVIARSFGSVEATLEKLKNRFVRRVEDKETLMRQHLESVYEAILPGGKLQERMMGSVYFDNKYGDAWIKRIVSEIHIHTYEHQVVQL